MKTENISNIGTLGNNSNDVTCSILAAKSLGASFEVTAFSEFELAAESLVNNEIDAMLVPGAYPSISKFIMNRELTVIDTFMYVIPSLVFASYYKAKQSEYDILYNHPATNPLLNDICDAEWDAQENVSSNTAACLKVLENKHTSCAITNSACAERYGLVVHQVIRKGINMPFVIFIKKEK